MKERIFLPIAAMIGLASPAIRSLAQSNYEPYTFSTLAESGDYTYEDVPAASAFISPDGVAVDREGNVYFTSNNTVRRLTPAGWVRTLAGLARVSGSADGTGKTARFNHLQGI